MIQISMGRPAALHGLFLCFIGIWFAAYSALHLEHNDFMYAAASVSSGTLYKDIHYVQAPLGFRFLEFLGVVVPTGYKLLVLRVTSTLLVIGSICLAAAYVLETNLGRWSFLLFSAGSIYLLKIGAEIGTYSLALFLLTCALITALRSNNHAVYVLLSGLCVGLAGSVKFNHYFFLPIFIFVVVAISSKGTAPERSGYRGRDVYYAGGLCVLGFLLGALPSLIEVFRSPKAFYLHNLYFHRLTNVYRGLSLLDSIRSIATGSYTFLAAHLPILAATVLVLRRGSAPERTLSLILLLAVFSYVVSCSPMVLPHQYLAPTSFFLGLAFCRALENQEASVQRIMAWCIFPFFFVNVMNHSSDLLQSRRSTFTLVDGLSVNRKIASFHHRLRSGTPDCRANLFTFSGALAVDSGFTLMKFTEAGIFWRRLAASIPNAVSSDPGYEFDSRLTNPVSYLRTEASTFLLTGWYPEFESDIVEFAHVKGLSSYTFAQGGKRFDFWFPKHCLIN